MKTTKGIIKETVTSRFGWYRATAMGKQPGKIIRHVMPAKTGSL